VSSSRRVSRAARNVSILAALIAAAAVVIQRTPAASASTAPKLSIEEIGSDTTAFDVVATLITGPREALLWDTQYHLADARHLADRVAASGKRLKAIVISHPDHDHFAGAAAIVERFPGTPVYMTAKALEEYKRTAPPAFRNEKSRAPQLLPDSIVTPQVLPSMQLTVDGEKVEVIPDLTGDVITGVNSVLWIPSISTVLASDVVFNGVHAWLGSSDTTSRRAWRASIERIAALHPKVVVAGHKKDIAAPDTPDVLDAMDRYLADFDSLRKTSVDGPALFAAMKAKYADYAVPNLLRYSAMAAFRRATPSGALDDARMAGSARVMRAASHVSLKDRDTTDRSASHMRALHHTRRIRPTDRIGATEADRFLPDERGASRARVARCFRPAVARAQSGARSDGRNPTAILLRRSVGRRLRGWSSGCDGGRVRHRVRGAGRWRLLRLEPRHH
jgi:glyoxylase-like metal-dependent hydrolase (beta-lactamase superfamily II)